mmetsp:Transcript_19902/g.45914  ORF Transcript_19902/g.45914 Transcript_19902/m.45914 type:complete len:108 (-) Transcript_19902:201-524(-)
MSEASQSVSVETLERAVRRMDPDLVLLCLESGVYVNDPIDRHGHTVMDVYACEHENMMKTSMSSRGRSADATRVFCEMQSNATQVLNLLRAYGAVMSGRSATRRRGL